MILELKEALQKSANRHTERVLSDLEEVIDLPKMARDRIRQEIEYATKDGSRITARHD